MPKYVLNMSRDTSQTVAMIVEADDEDDALDKAYQAARNESDLPWEDDDFVGKPYCSNYEDLEEYDPSLHPSSAGYYELREE